MWWPKPGLRVSLSARQKGPQRHPHRNPGPVTLLGFMAKCTLQPVDVTTLRDGVIVGGLGGAPLTAGPLKVFPQAAGTSERGEAAVGSHAHAGAEMLSPHARTRERPLGTPRKALEGTWGPGQAHSQHECNHLGN